MKSTVRKREKWLKCFSLLVFVTLFYSQAEARRFKIGFVGSYGMTNVSQSAGTGAAQISLGETDQSKNFGAGAIIEFGILGPLGLEIGAFYQPRGFQDGDSKDEVKYNTNLLTAMLRFDFGSSSDKLKLPVSLGLGAYYSESLDDQVTSVDGTTKTSSKVDFSDTNLPLGAMGKIDRGLLASLSVDYPMSKNFFFTFDLRYMYGLTQILTAESSTGVSGRWEETSTLAGIVLKF